MSYFRHPMLAAILGTPLTLLSAGVMAQDPAPAPDNSNVDQRIQTMEAELEKLKSEVNTNKDDIEFNRPAKKGTQFQYGGYIQLDAIYTDYAEGKPGNDLIEDLLVPSLIPVENKDPAENNDSFQSTNFSVKTSRFYFTTLTNTNAGAVSSRIELDFLVSGQGDERISNSSAARLRHAFVKWDYGKRSSLLAGQTWSTFFNVGALPDLLDFVGPVGTLFNRQPMIRWTTGGFQFALENPYTRLDTAKYVDTDDDGVPDTPDRVDVRSDSEVIPDIILRYNGAVGGLGWSLAAIGRQLSYDARDNGGNTQVADDKTYGYGLSLAGKWIFGKDDLRFMASYGNALGRYIGLNSFNDGYIGADGKIETFTQYGGFIAYRHFWSDHWRSTFSISASKADNPDDAFTDAGLQSTVDGWAKAYQSAHVNLNYMPTPALQLGGELIYAKKEVEDGREGDLTRVQFAVKYAF